VLLLHELRGTEGISRLFRFQLELLSLNASISYKDILGKKVSISILLDGDGRKRSINGYVSSFSQGGTDDRFTHYQADVVPWLWFLSRSADCRIFQDKNVPAIIEQVFRDLQFQDYEFSLNRSNYQPLPYCVQYRETDLNFVSRLMEQYGIFYYFEHKKDKHTLVVCDAPPYQPCPEQEKAIYDAGVSNVGLQDVVTGWDLCHEVHPGEYVLNDYNFETPSTSLLSSSPTSTKAGGNDKFEVYDYPGDYATKDAGDNLVRLRMEEEETAHIVVHGRSTCRAFTSGYRFELQNHTRRDQNKQWLLTDMQMSSSVGDGYETSEANEGSAGEYYSNHFVCIAASIKFRPPRLTAKPFVQGPQTAVVVGKSREEIWVDKYGRVKVQFFWDRAGKKDENSSCWVRVSQPWAGKNWGAIWIPRIGQEVIVEFLEGDPDRPIITGRVYNAEQMPPYTLPDNQTRSTYMSRSSKGGGSSNFNELRFEDKMGSEQIFINAEKDMDLRVENDSREFVGNDRHLSITGNQNEKVGGDRNEQVTGDHNEKIGGALSLNVTGDSNEKIGGSMSINISQSLNEKTGMNFEHEAGQEIYLKAGMNVVIESGLQLTIKAGGNFVNIGPAGVAISGTLVLINSGGAAGSGSGAQTQDPKDPKDPDIADDGSKGTKM
jgi:type VI secretion system secreted protein VgrG